MQENCRWHCFDNDDQVAAAACLQILDAAERAIAEHGVFKLVLAGGTTPVKVYRLLAQADANWAKWVIYYGDERCLPRDHEERNSLMVDQVLLRHVNIPANQVHDIPAELGNVEGAKAYAKTLVGVPTFDIVLLGLGEDGHTASLFPNHAVDNSADAVPVFNSPKPPAERVTMSQNRLNNTREVIFIVTGAGKQEAVDNWRNGVAIPATLIAPDCGVNVYCFGVKLKP